MKVLDTSGILRSDLDFSDSCYLITNGILQELESEHERIAVNAAIDRGLIEVKEPDGNSISKVKKTAGQSGDLEKLSENDISVLALALETDSSIVSDDYNIQNLARILGLKYERTAHPGIKKRVRWIKVCEGCGREGEDYVCRVCGSRLRRISKSLD